MRQKLTKARILTWAIKDKVKYLSEISIYHFMMINLTYLDHDDYTKCGYGTDIPCIS